MTASNKLNLKIVVGATDNASKTLQKVNGTMAGMGRALGRVRDFTIGLGRVFIDAGRKAAVFGSVAGAALGALVQRVTSAGDRTIKLARHLNVNAEKLQAWRFAAKDAGVEASAFEGAMTKLGTSLGEAAGGNGRAREYIALLREIGVEFEDAEGKAKSMTTIFPEIADALQRLPDEQKRAAFSKALFGEGNFMILDALKDGAAGLEAAEAAARRAGAILSEDQLLGFEQFQQVLHEISVEFVGITNQLVSSLLPTIKMVADAFKGWLVGNQEQFREWATWLRETLPQAVGVFHRALTGLAEAWGPHINEMWTAMLGGWERLEKLVGGTASALARAVDMFERLNRLLGVPEKLWDVQSPERRETENFLRGMEKKPDGTWRWRGAKPTDAEVLELFERDFLKPKAPASGEVKVSFANMPRGARVTRDDAARRSVALNVGYAMPEVGFA